MNINDYISSGILELYVSGDLSESERKEVEAQAALHPEIREELNAIEIAMEKYAMMHAVEPSKHVLQSILAEVENTQVKTTSPKVVQMKPKSTGNILRSLAYAASILLFISVAVNVYYFNKYKTVSGELADIREDNTFMAGEFETLKVNYQTLQSDLNIIKNPAYIAVTMKGQPISPSAASMVYWDKTTGQVYVYASKLPAPEAGKQYQLWALKDGKPIDAGVFDINGDLQQMKRITEADAFAVTLEPVGGSETPTLEQLYVVGGV